MVWVLWSLTAVGAATGWLAYWYPFAVNVVGVLLVAGVSVFGLFLATLPNYALPPSVLARSRGMRWLAPTLRAGVNLCVEALLAGIALMAAFLLRWGDDFTGVFAKEFLVSLPVVMMSQFISSLMLRTWGIGWRWFGMADAVRLGQASLLSSALSVMVLMIVQLRDFSRGVLVLYTLLVFGVTIGLRLFLPVLRSVLGTSATSRSRTAIVGAVGDSAVLMRVVEESGFGDLLPVLILDTGDSTDRARMFGVPVLSFAANAPELLRQFQIECVVVTEADDEFGTQLQLLSHCVSKGITVRRFQYVLSPVALDEARLFANSTSV